MITDDIAVIDTDSHLSELPDLWLSRMPSKWADVAPTIKYLPSQGEEDWFIGGHPTHPAWTNSQAKGGNPHPSHPRGRAPAGWASRVIVVPPTEICGPPPRTGALDDFGVASQVLYPNIVAFHL